MAGVRDLKGSVSTLHERMDRFIGAQTHAVAHSEEQPCASCGPELDNPWSRLAKLFTFP
jgi:hypothetical protein